MEANQCFFQQKFEGKDKSTIEETSVLGGGGGQVSQSKRNTVCALIFTQLYIRGFCGLETIHENLD